MRFALFCVMAFAAVALAYGQRTPEIPTYTTIKSGSLPIVARPAAGFELQGVDAKAWERIQRLSFLEPAAAKDESLDAQIDSIARMRAEKLAKQSLLRGASKEDLTELRRLQTLVQNGKKSNIKLGDEVKKLNALKRKLKAKASESTSRHSFKSDNSSSGGKKLALSPKLKRLLKAHKASDAAKAKAKRAAVAAAKAAADSKRKLEAELARAKAEANAAKKKLAKISAALKKGKKASKGKKGKKASKGKKGKKAGKGKKASKGKKAGKGKKGKKQAAKKQAPSKVELELKTVEKQMNSLRDVVEALTSQLSGVAAPKPAAKKPAAKKPAAAAKKPAVAKAPRFASVESTIESGLNTENTAEAEAETLAEQQTEAEQPQNELEADAAAVDDLLSMME